MLEEKTIMRIIPVIPPILEEIIPVIPPILEDNF